MRDNVGDVLNLKIKTSGKGQLVFLSFVALTCSSCTYTHTHTKTHFSPPVRCDVRAERLPKYKKINNHLCRLVGLAVFWLLVHPFHRVRLVNANPLDVGE